MSGFLIDQAWLVPFFPLLGALVAAVGGRWLGERSHWPVVAGIGLACVVSFGLYGSVGSGEGRTVLYDWIRAGSQELDGALHVPIELRVDGLTTMMLAMVTFVATLVTVFAIGYMAGDPGYPRFFAVVGLFVFSMTGLVLSNNFVLTYVFWEGVGVCSYLLIGYWHEKPEAAAAAKKAFLVNRIGDFGFALAIFWLWTVVPGHSLSYDKILTPEIIQGYIPHEAKLGIALLLFWAATAKSAQVPLYVWLPDAMEGPTPVSALIHAATMVTAGVYLIARTSLLVMSGPIVPLVIAVVGCLTALLAAAIALTQNDLKRVLAYSTVSQLGFMFMALGAGVGDLMQLAVVAAMFHLFTHAFFKALLFLGSGSVMHSMGGVIDMRRFGGLRRRMPWTCGTFAVGALALAGVPPLAGFWSKDEILAALRLASHAEQTGFEWIYGVIYWTAVVTAFLTAFYTGRAFFRTFFGPEKLPSADDPEVREVPADPPHAMPALPIDTSAPETAQLSEYDARMGIPRPTVVGATGTGPATVSGVDPHRPADLPPPSRGSTDEPVPQHDHGGHGHGDHFGHESPPSMVVPLVILSVCAALVGLVFGPPTGLFEHHVIERTPYFAGFLGHPREAHGTDWVSVSVGTLVGVLGLALAWLMYGHPSPLPSRLARALGPLYRASHDKFRVDEAYEALIVVPTNLLAVICRWIDVYVVDGLVRLAAFVPGFVGRYVLAPTQNGLIQFYAAATAIGLAGLLLWLILS